MLVFMFVVTLTLFLRAVGPDLRARFETGLTTRTTARASDESDPPPAPATTEEEEEERRSTDEWTVHEPAQCVYAQSGSPIVEEGGEKGESGGGEQEGSA